MRTNPRKPPAGAAAYRRFQLAMNPVGAFVVSLAIAAVTFISFGPGRGEIIESLVYAVAFVIVFTVIQAYSVTSNTRRDFFRGKWEIQAGTGPAASMNPWRNIAPPSIVAGAVSAAMTAGCVLLSGHDELTFWVIVVLGFVGVTAGSTAVLLWRLERDQKNLASAAAGGPPARAGFGHYFIAEHLVAWFALQGTINFGIGVKQFRWLVAREFVDLSGVPTSYSVGDVGVVCLIVCFFVLLAVDVQVRPDVRLGRLPGRRFSVSLLDGAGFLTSAAVVLGYSAVAGIMSGLAAHAIYRALGVVVLTVLQASVVKMGSALAGVVAGAALGVFWGVRQETARMTRERAA